LQDVDHAAAVSGRNFKSPSTNHHHSPDRGRHAPSSPNHIGEKIRSTVQRLARIVSTCSMELTGVRESWEREEGSLRKEYAHKEQALTNALNKVERLADALAECEREKQEALAIAEKAKALHHFVGEQAEGLAHAAQQLPMARAEATRLRGELDRCKEKMYAAQDKVDSLQKALEGLRGKSAEEAAENEWLRMESMKAKAHCMGAEEETKGLRAAVLEMKKDLLTCKERMNTAETDNIKLESKLAVQSVDISAYSERLNAQQTALAMSNEVRDERDGGGFSAPEEEDFMFLSSDWKERHRTTNTLEREKDQV
jgi:chromosome segregation ATPase